ncbi:MAG: hypothetical protein ABH883_04220, partial [Candidatus Omnitrophota bacterium]
EFIEKFIGTMEGWDVIQLEENGEKCIVDPLVGKKYKFPGGKLFKVLGVLPDNSMFVKMENGTQIVVALEAGRVRECAGASIKSLRKAYSEIRSQERLWHNQYANLSIEAYMEEKSKEKAEEKKGYEHKYIIKKAMGSQGVVEVEFSLPNGERDPDPKRFEGEPALKWKDITFHDCRQLFFKENSMDFLAVVYRSEARCVEVFGPLAGKWDRQKYDSLTVKNLYNGAWIGVGKRNGRWEVIGPLARKISREKLPPDDADIHTLELTLLLPDGRWLGDYYKIGRPPCLCGPLSGEYYGKAPAGDHLKGRRFRADGWWAQILPDGRCKVSAGYGPSHARYIMRCAGMYGAVDLDVLDKYFEGVRPDILWRLYSERKAFYKDTGRGLLKFILSDMAPENIEGDPVVRKRKAPYDVDFDMLEAEKALEDDLETALDIISEFSADQIWRLQRAFSSPVLKTGLSWIYYEKLKALESSTRPSVINKVLAQEKFVLHKLLYYDAKGATCRDKYSEISVKYMRKYKEDIIDFFRGKQSFSHGEERVLGIEAITDREFKYGLLWEIFDALPKITTAGRCEGNARFILKGIFKNCLSDEDSKLFINSGVENIIKANMEYLKTDSIEDFQEPDSYIRFLTRLSLPELKALREMMKEQDGSARFIFILDWVIVDRSPEEDKELLLKELVFRIAIENGGRQLPDASYYYEPLETEEIMKIIDRHDDIVRRALRVNGAYLRDVYQKFYRMHKKYGFLVLWEMLRYELEGHTEDEISFASSVEREFSREMRACSRELRGLFRSKGTMPEDEYGKEYELILNRIAEDVVRNFIANRAPEDRKDLYWIGWKTVEKILRDGPLPPVSDVDMDNFLISMGELFSKTFCQKYFSEKSPLEDIMSLQFGMSWEESADIFKYLDLEYVMDIVKSDPDKFMAMVKRCSGERALWCLEENFEDTSLEHNLVWDLFRRGEIDMEKALILTWRAKSTSLFHAESVMEIIEGKKSEFLGLASGLRAGENKKLIRVFRGTKAEPDLMWLLF